MASSHRFAIRSSTFVSLFALGAVLTGCSAAGDAPPVLGTARSADAIAPIDDPEGLLGTVSFKLADNLVLADVGKTYGTPDATVPYPDTYWPMSANGIDVQWDGSQPSPLAKYMNMADPTDAAAASTWNALNQGNQMPNVQPWYGICQGWTGAAIAVPPVTHAVYAKLVNGQVTTCAATDATCTRFDLGDVNALLAEVYSDAYSKFIGARCDTAPSNIVRDANGRISRTANGAGCKGLNAAALVIVLGTRMKRDQLPIAIDAQNDFNTDQIWNQPAYRYTVNQLTPLTLPQAANMVAYGTQTGDQTTYPWNTAAKGFALVDITLDWVTEDGPNLTYVSGLASTNQTRMVAVLELDADMSDPNANLLGGEYVVDASAGADRLTVPPFVWITTSAGPEVPAAGGHNPYVKTSLVSQLATLGAH